MAPRGIVAVLAAFAVQAKAVELTKASWDEKTAGKSVFVKFFAPWCGHCKNMKPAWDQLMTEFDGHKSILVADVDCIADGKEMCEEVGVQGFPTIKYGDPNSLQDYEGGRDYDELKKFAESSLGPSCGPSHPELCDAKSKEMLDSMMKMPMKDLTTAIEGKEGEMKKAETELEELLKSLQSQYEEAQKKRDETKTAIKESGLGMMKSVLAHRKSEKSEL